MDLKNNFSQSLLLRLFAGLLLVIGISALIAYIPKPGYLFSDWPYFQGASRSILRGNSPYDLIQLGLFIYNPPWIFVLLIPFSLFPPEFSAGLMVTVSILIALILCRHFKFSLMRTVFFMISPPVIINLLMGQINLLVLGGILLPISWWPLMAVSKPQLTLGLGFQALGRPYLKKAVIQTLVVFGLSFVFFGFWPLQILQAPSPLKYDWNIWIGVWPWPVLPGLVLILLGKKQNDFRYFLAASPFLVPYATIPSLLGTILAAISYLKDWQAGILTLLAWGLVIISIA